MKTNFFVLRGRAADVTYCFDVSQVTDCQEESHHNLVCDTNMLRGAPQANTPCVSCLRPQPMSEALTHHTQTLRFVVVERGQCLDWLMLTRVC